MGEGQGPRLGQADRIAFLVGRGRIGIDLVEKDVACRRRAQAHGRVRPGHDQYPAREFLREHRIAGIPRSGWLHPFTQGRAFLDQRIDALARVSFGEFHGRLHRQHRPRGMGNHEADHVVARFRRAHLRGFHEHHPLGRMTGRERIHDLAHIGRAAGPIAPGFGRGARGQHAVLVGPLGHRQIGVGLQPFRPGTAQIIVSVEFSDANCGFR